MNTIEDSEPSPLLTAKIVISDKPVLNTGLLETYSGRIGALESERSHFQNIYLCNPILTIGNLFLRLPRVEQKLERLYSEREALEKLITDEPQHFQSMAQVIEFPQPEPDLVSEQAATHVTEQLA